MNTKILLCTISLFLLGASSLDAQVYRTAIGARFDDNAIGFTVAQKIARKVTLEGIWLQDDFAQQQGYLMAKRHFGFMRRRLNVYMGAGVHAGFDPEYIGWQGYDLMGGAEFTFLRITVAADVKPEWEFGTNQYVGLNPSVSLRYSLFRDRRRSNNCSPSRNNCW